jgi:hypothetical protein
MTSQLFTTPMSVTFDHGTSVRSRFHRSYPSHPPISFSAFLCDPLHLCVKKTISQIRPSSSVADVLSCITAISLATERRNVILTHLFGGGRFSLA